MPAPSPSLPTPQEVSTEPQLAELNRMSNELRGRLEAMIVEQRERVQKFTESQHSLSPLPVAPSLPDLPQPAPLPVSKAAQAPVRAPQTRQMPAPPPLPTQPRQAAPTQTAPRQYRQTPPAPAQHGQEPEQEERESAGSYGWLISLGIFILIIVLRSCD